MSLDYFNQGDKPFKDSSFRGKLNAMVNALNGLLEEPIKFGGELLEIENDSAFPGFFAKITDVYSDDGGRLYQYEWIEQQFDGTWSDKPDGRKFQDDSGDTDVAAMNMHEWLDSSVPSGSYQPVPNDRIVWMWRIVQGGAEHPTPWFMEINEQSRKIWIKIGDHYNRSEPRIYDYDWQEMIPSSSGDGTWTDGTLNQDSTLPPSGAAYGQATNGMEFQDSDHPNVWRPMRKGAIVQASIFITTVGDATNISVQFSQSNSERQFFAKVTEFSDGLYSWTECYADGTSIPSADGPRSGSEAVNSYYGIDAEIPESQQVPSGKVVLMESLPSIGNPDQVGFCLKMDAEETPIRGDDMGASVPTLPDPYPPNTGVDTGGSRVGGEGAWIEVWEVDDPASTSDPKTKIKKIFHLEPNEPKPGDDFTTCTATVTDGGDPDGGGAGKIEFEDIKVEPDATGHIADSNPEEYASVINAGDHIVINGSDKSATINHSKPSAPSSHFSATAESSEGGASIHFAGFGWDVLGHVEDDSEGDSSILFIGDAWIDVALGDTDEIEITHQAAQSDGAQMISGNQVTITPGSTTGGSIEVKVVNPYVDSKGHVNVGSSSSANPTITAGTRLKISGSGSSATLDYVPGTAGTATSIGDVVTNVALSGGNLVQTKQPIMVTTDSDGYVTSVALGTSTTTTIVGTVTPSC